MEMTMKITRDFGSGPYTFELTPEEIEKAYRVQERIYRLEDARIHVDPYVESGDVPEKAVSDEALSDLVDLFFDRCDCNAPENDVWDLVIEEYFLQGNDHERALRDYVRDELMSEDDNTWELCERLAKSGCTDRVIRDLGFTELASAHVEGALSEEDGDDSSPDYEQILLNYIREERREYDDCEIYDRFRDCGYSDGEIVALGFPDLIPLSFEEIREKVHKIYEDLVDNGIDETDHAAVNKLAGQLVSILKERTDIFTEELYKKVTSAYATVCEFQNGEPYLDVDEIIGFLGEALAD